MKFRLADVPAGKVVRSSPRVLCCPSRSSPSSTSHPSKLSVCSPQCTNSRSIIPSHTIQCYIPNECGNWSPDFSPPSSLHAIFTFSPSQLGTALATSSRKMTLKRERLIGASVGARHPCPASTPAYFPTSASRRKLARHNVPCARIVRP